MTTKMRAAIYARVSTAEQDPGVQLHQLVPFVERRGWTLAGQFVDHGVSGAKASRPALDKLLAAARARKIDVIVVWALDRLGRSLQHLLAVAEELKALGVDLACVSQSIDTTTPAGQLTFSVLGACGEFERAMLRDRVCAGLAKARATGVRLGRPRSVLDLDDARRQLAKGQSLREVARSLGTNHATLRRALARGSETPLAAVGT